MFALFYQYVNSLPVTCYTEECFYYCQLRNGTVVQIEKEQINNRLRVSKVC